MPDELLLSIFDKLDIFQRSMLLSICKRWNEALLSNHSFWNSLILPPRHSFEETLFILKLFNARSECKLKHAVLGLKLQNAKQVSEIFRELKRSGNSLKTLGLAHEPGLGKIIRVLARTFLPKLNTIALSYKEVASFSYWNSAVWLNREELKVIDEDEGIRFCQLDEFGDFQSADKSWVSKSKYISIESTTSIDDLIFLLKAAELSLVDLDLEAFAAEPLASMNTNQTSMMKVSRNFTLEGPVELRVPSDPDVADLLGRLMTIEDTSGLLLKGSIESLLAFKLVGVKRLELTLYPDTDPDTITLSEISVETDLCLKPNQTVEELTLDCRRNGICHLKLVLEKLLISSQDPIDHPFSLLPNLVKLVIQDPRQLDVELVQKVIESRRSVVPTFQFVYEENTDEEGILEMEDWAERDWTK